MVKKDAFNLTLSNVNLAFRPIRTNSNVKAEASSPRNLYSDNYRASREEIAHYARFLQLSNVTSQIMDYKRALLKR